MTILSLVNAVAGLFALILEMIPQYRKQNLFDKNMGIIIGYKKIEEGVSKRMRRCLRNRKSTFRGLNAHFFFLVNVNSSNAYAKYFLVISVYIDNLLRNNVSYCLIIIT